MLSRWDWRTTGILILILAWLAPGASAQDTETRLTLAIATPQADTPALAYSFADKLLAQLQRSTDYHVQLLEGVTDPSQAQAIAERSGFDYLAMSELEAKEKRQIGKGILNKAAPKRFEVDVKQKLRVSVSYELLALGADSARVAKGKVPAPKRATTDAVGAVAQRVSSDLTKALKSAKRQRNPDTLLPGYEPRLVVQTAHSTAISDFMYSPDSSRLATLGADGVIKVWNVFTGMELNTIVAPSTVGISFSPKGRQLAALSRQGVVRVFDADTGNLVRRLTSTKREEDTSTSEAFTFAQNAIDVAFSPDGSLLAHGGEHGISLWEVETGVLIRDGDENEGVSQLALSPKGDLVAGVLGERRIKVLSVETGRKLHMFRAKVGQVTTLRFSPDGSALAVGSKNGSILMYDAVAGTEIGEPPVYSVCDKPFENTGALDRVTDVTDIQATETMKDARNVAAGACAATAEVKRIRAEGFGAFYTGSVRSIAISPDGRQLAYGRGDGNVRVLDLTQNAALSFEISTNPEHPLLAEGTEEGVMMRALRALAPDFWGQPPVKFSVDGSTLDIVERRKTVSRWAASNGERLSSLAVSKRDLSFGSVIPIPMASVPIFGEDDRTLLTATITGGTRLWDLRSGLPPRFVSRQNAASNASPISADTSYSVATEQDGEDVAVVVREVESQVEYRRYPLNTTMRLFRLRAGASAGATFSPDSSLLLIAGTDADGRWIKAIHLARDEEVFFARNVEFLGFSPDSGLLAYRHLATGPLPKFGNKVKLTVIDTTDWTSVFETRTSPSEFGVIARGVAFSADSRLIAVPEENGIGVWALSSGKKQGEYVLEDDALSDFLFRPGTTKLTMTTRRSLLHWDVTNNEVERSNQYTDFFGNLSYSADGRLLALGGAENRIRLFDVDADIEAGSLVVPNDEDWLTVTPEGRFDARWLEDVEEVHWVLSDEPDRTHPIELFMREYYEPQLLARLVDREPLAEVPALHTRNRALPSVRFTKVTAAGKGKLRVSVEVIEGVSEIQADSKGQALRSGGAALRLFRDKRLVGYAPDDLGELDFDDQGVARHTFTIDVPTKSSGEVELSAYAMNASNIKGPTARTQHALAGASGGAKRRLYIVAMGVDANEQSAFALKHTVNDARMISEQLVASAKGGEFDEVIPVTLTSPVDGPSQATKQNLQAVLAVLAGRGSASAIRALPGGSKLRRAAPDDLVVITYSGHGYTDPHGEFYLLPSDLGTGQWTSLVDLLPRAVSSDELSTWLADVDAEITMVVDACFSAAAIDTPGFKAGPMGSRGLGQLAYDKGMRVLTGAQSDQVAIESSQLSHGLLTYALMQHGVVERGADYSPRDGRIVMREWLQYPLRRVPELHEELESRSDGEDNSKGLRLAGRWRAQQPVVFNFSRSPDGPVLLGASR